MMDHDQAIQTQASMRYALGELTPAERDSFEEHFADCSHCMSDVDVATAFSANAREVFRERASAGSREWGFAWLRWRPFPTLALSAALNVILVAGLGYGLLRVHPAAPVDVASVNEPQSVDVIAVRGVTRGSQQPARVVHASRRPIVLTFDLLQHYEHYFYSIEQAGSAVMSGEVKVAGTPDSLNLQIPVTRLSAGEYKVTVKGATGSAQDDLGSCLLQVETH